jgi:hypothetical protein
MQCNAGLAFFNGLIVEASFPRLFYRLLLGGAPTMADLAELDPPMHRCAYYVCACVLVCVCMRVEGEQALARFAIGNQCVYIFTHTQQLWSNMHTWHRNIHMSSSRRSLYHSYRNLTALLSMSEQELHGLDMTFQVH